MKYLITESQLDKVIFRYLDNQDFIVTGNDTSLFFVNSDDDKYAQIKYDEQDEKYEELIDKHMLKDSEESNMEYYHYLSKEKKEEISLTKLV